MILQQLSLWTWVVSLVFFRHVLGVAESETDRLVDLGIFHAIGCTLQQRGNQTKDRSKSEAFHLREKAIHVEKFVNGASTDKEQHNCDCADRPRNPIQHGIEKRSSTPRRSCV